VWLWLCLCALCCSCVVCVCVCALLVGACLYVAYVCLVFLLALESARASRSHARLFMFVCFFAVFFLLPLPVLLTLDTHKWRTAPAPSVVQPVKFSVTTAAAVVSTNAVFSTSHSRHAWAKQQQ
jgi:hypothetical protein